MSAAFGLLEDEQRLGHNGAIAACVVQGDQVVGERYLGRTSSSDDAMQVDAHTPFDLASVTKVFTAATTLMLVEQGALTLGETLAESFPEWSGTRLGERTVFELLTHTARLPRRIDYYLLGEFAVMMSRYQSLHPFLEVRETTVQRVIDSLASIELVGPTGARYTSVGYLILGILLERVAASRLDELMQRLVIEPLGLEATAFSTPESRKGAAATARCAWRGGVAVGVVHDELAYALGGIAGHAGLFSTARDVALFGAAFDSAGAVTRPWLSEQAVALMTSTLATGVAGNRGLGWETWSVHSFMGDLVSRRAFGHTGFTGTSLCVDPAIPRSAALLTNAIHPNREATTAHSLRRRFHNLAFRDATGGGSVR